MAMHSKKVVGNYARKGACGSSAGSTPVVASEEVNKGSLKMTENINNDPHRIIGKELPAADGSNLGVRVLSYNPQRDDYVVENIKWSTGETFDNIETHFLGAFKITYRYQVDKARSPLQKEKASE